ncbi:MAG TPA: SpoIIE family protein phosphatase [Terriglobia bacterium]|nr:SpoIIE family protein phosphatase [Terriglobia bacterium]
MQALTLPGNLDALEPIRDYVKNVAQKAGLEDAATYKLCLAVDEIATNVVVHGYQEAGLSGDLTVRGDIDEARLVVQLQDTGKSYDPTKHSVPDTEVLSRPLNEREMGGLGIALALDGVDDLQYEAGEQGNVHRFVVNLPKERPRTQQAEPEGLSDEHRKLRILLNISRSLGQEIKLDRLLTLIVGEVTSAMDAERTSLLLYDSRSGELCSKVAEGMSTREIRVPLGSGIAGATAQSRKIINIPDAYADSRFNPSYDKASGFRTRSILSAPIINQSARLIGVVQVLNKINQPAFTTQDEHFLEAICIHLGIALERAEMVEAYLQGQILKQSLQLAREIQMGLVPKEFPAFPQIPRIDIFALLEPAQDVGGDLYDYFLLDGNRICFIIGDVSDKGVPAALFMAMVRTAFRMAAIGAGEPIGTILQKLNAFLCESNQSQMFVTVFAGVLDLRTGTIEYADGGHEPPFIVRQNGGATMIQKVGGLALGFVPEYQFRCGRIQLDSGDSLVLYTDGITEAMNSGHELFGAERIRETLDRVASGIMAQALTKTLLGGVAAFTAGAQQSDDITLLVIRYLAE